MAQGESVMLAISDIFSRLRKKPSLSEAPFPGPRMGGSLLVADMLVEMPAMHNVASLLVAWWSDPERILWRLRRDTVDALAQLSFFRRVFEDAAADLPGPVDLECDMDDPDGPSLICTSEAALYEDREEFLEMVVTILAAEAAELHNENLVRGV